MVNGWLANLNPAICSLLGNFLHPFLQFRAAICWVTSDLKLFVFSPFAIQLFANPILQMEFSKFVQFPKMSEQKQGESGRSFCSKELLEHIPIR